MTKFHSHSLKIYKRLKEKSQRRRKKYQILEKQINWSQKHKLVKPFIIKNSEKIIYQKPQTVIAYISPKIQISSPIMIPYKELGEQTFPKSYKIPYEQTLNPQFRKKFNISIPQMKLNQKQVKIPNFVKKYFYNSKIVSINLWHYFQKTITNWHYDGHDNFLFMLKGIKIVQLSSPSTDVSTHSVFSAYNNQILPKKQLKECTIFIVKAPNCLFIPRGWLHRVKSFGKENIAINIWGHSIKINQKQSKIFLKSLIWDISQNISKKQVKNWNLLSQALKQKYRQAYFHKYLKQL